MGDEGQPERLYKLALEGNGVTINKEIPESIALQIISLAMGGQPNRVTTVKPISGSLAMGGAARTSVREFMSQVGAKRNPDKIVAIGAYLMQELGRETFTRKDVKEQFMNAREPVPGNYTRDFDWAVSNGWLAPTPGSIKDYYVTNSGLVAITNQFSHEVLKASKFKRRKLLKRPGSSQPQQ